MEDNLLKKLELLKIKITDQSSQREIFGWEDQARNYLVVLSLKENKGIKIIFDRFASELLNIRELLLNADSKLLSENQRDRVLDRKAMYERFLSLFADSEKGLADLEKKVDNEIAE